MPTAPSTENLYLGKGALKFNELDSDGLPTGLRHLGNAPSFTILPVVEQLDHYSSLSGTKAKDLSVNTTVSATLKFSLEEYDPENIRMAFLGTKDGNTIHGLTKPNLIGEIQFFGANDVGPNYNASCWKVKLKPTSDIPLITDAFGTLQFEGEILADAANHPSSPFFDIELVIAS